MSGIMEIKATRFWFPEAGRPKDIFAAVVFSALNYSSFPNESG